MGLPLDGIRILDFTWVRAGPWATRWLGALGAEVIKVQWPANLGIRTMRGPLGPGEREPDPNSNGGFVDANVNKLGITLNVRSPKGMELTRRLVGLSDLVIENFSSTVLTRWGLGYEEMQKLNPRIIYVSMAGFGHAGRHHHYNTMGPSAQSLGGLQFLSGLPGKTPAGWGFSYLDDTGGLYGAMCALTAIHHRNATGQGQHVDLSQMMAAATLAGATFLDRSVNGRKARREGFPPGNRAVWPGTPLMNNYRGPIAVPHNAYRTKPGGYNDWCAITCFSDQEWNSLVAAMGSPSWAWDSKFASLMGRLDHQEDLDREIERWTLTMDKYEVTEKCQAQGVRAMPVQSSEDRVEHDPQLREQGMYPELEHPDLGRIKHQDFPFKLSEAPVGVSNPAPMLGQHTREVMERLLGLDLEEIQQGFRDGTFWPEDMPQLAHIEEMLK